MQFYSTVEVGIGFRFEDTTRGLRIRHAVLGRGGTLGTGGSNTQARDAVGSRAKCCEQSQLALLEHLLHLSPPPPAHRAAHNTVYGVTTRLGRRNAVSCLQDQARLFHIRSIATPVHASHIGGRRKSQVHTLARVRDGRGVAQHGQGVRSTEARTDLENMECKSCVTVICVTRDSPWMEAGGRSASGRTQQKSRTCTLVRTNVVDCSLVFWVMLFLGGRSH